MKFYTNKDFEEKLTEVIIGYLTRGYVFCSNGNNHITGAECSINGLCLHDENNIVFCGIKQSHGTISVVSTYDCKWEFGRASLNFNAAYHEYMTCYRPSYYSKGYYVATKEEAEEQENKRHERYKRSMDMARGESVKALPLNQKTLGIALRFIHRHKGYGTVPLENIQWITREKNDDGRSYKVGFISTKGITKEFVMA